MSIFVFILPCLFILAFVIELFYFKLIRDYVEFILVLIITLVVTVPIGTLVVDYINGVEVKETTAQIFEPDDTRDRIINVTDGEGNKYWGIEPFMGVIACDGKVRITYLPNTKYLLKAEQYITPGEIDLMVSPTGHATGYKELYNHSSFFGFACIVMFIIDLYVLFNFKKKKKKTNRRKHS